MKKIKVDLIKEHPVNSFLYKKRDNTSLINSIKENGITKSPVVNQDNILIAGHRTVAAAKEVSIKEISCQLVKTKDDKHHQVLLIMDNLCSRGGTELYPSEISKSISKLYELGGIKHGKKSKEDTVSSYKLEDLSKEISMDARTIRRYKALSTLITEYMDQLDEGKLKQSEALKIAKLSIEEQKSYIPTLPTKKDSTSSDNITTKGIKIVGDISTINTKGPIIDQEKVDYVNKHGNDIQRMAVKNKPEAVEGIYNSITTKQDHTSIPPTIMPPPVTVPPSTTDNITTIDWEVKYNKLWVSYEVLEKECLRLESENRKLFSKNDAKLQPEEEIDWENIDGIELDFPMIDTAPQDLRVSLIIRMQKAQERALQDTINTKEKRAI